MSELTQINSRHISGDCDLEKHLYINVKNLLRIYRKVSWRLKYSIHEIDSECEEKGYGRLTEVLTFWRDINLTKVRINQKLKCIEESKIMLEIIDRSLLLLKEYPDVGERYYTILYLAYCSEKKYTEDELIDKFNISRTTLYRDKRHAMELLGIMIFGFDIK